MKELARASWILFQAHLWRTFRTKRGLVAGLLAAGPVEICRCFFDKRHTFTKQLGEGLRACKPFAELNRLRLAR